jgi:nucleoid-associated protein YgaU
VDYWAQLVDANRDRLVDPDDPDLLLPGQVLVLPPVELSAG